MKSRSPAPDDETCPCGRRLPYRACCGLFHRGLEAVDAEALMRSRYSAYVVGVVPYLMRTWHASTRPARLELDGAPVRTTWLGLRVERHESTGPDSALVEFVARFRVGGGRAERLHEISRFCRIDGRWVYLEGTFPDR